MFNRRMFVALAVCLVVSASTAFAGNGGGTKKDSTVRVRNESENTLFAFVNVNANDIAVAAESNDPLRAFRDLGGKQIESNGQVDFKVRTGQQRVTVIDVEEGAAVFVDRNVSVDKGQTQTIVVRNDDLP